MRATLGFMLAGGALLGLFAVTGWSATAGGHPGRWLVGVWLAFIVATAVWFIWGAGLSLRRFGGPTRGGDTLMVAMVLALIAGGWSARGLNLLTRGAPIPEALAWTGVKPWGVVSVDGPDVVARGTLTTGFSTEIRRALADHPGVARLRIDSPGGSVGAADLVAAQVRSRGLTVSVDDYCASACLKIFLAGRERVVRPNARLGCHQRSDAVSGRSAGPARNFRDVRPPRTAQALHDRIVARCDATPPEALYEPRLSELIAINAVTHVRDGGRVLTAERYCKQAPRRCRVS